MKKIIICVLIFVLLLSSCGSQSGIESKPEGTSLEFWITEDVGEVDFSDYEINPGWFGAEEYYGCGYCADDEAFVTYLITAYPDYSCGGSFVTRIKVTDPKVIIMNGLTCASSVNAWSTTLTKMGFKESECSTTHGV